jgi:hypothetical protein
MQSLTRNSSVLKETRVSCSGMAARGFECLQVNKPQSAAKISQSKFAKVVVHPDANLPLACLRYVVLDALLAKLGHHGDGQNTIRRRSVSKLSI